jgi:glycogen debranching enzyme
MSINEEGFDRAVKMLHKCSNEAGFLASTTETANYQRVWGRDGSIMGLAALTTDNEELIQTCRNTLETLQRHQGEHGEIPSNVDPETGRISYGGTAGRVDANLWFVICCGEYWKRTGDDKFLDRMLESIEKVRFLLGAWEFNQRGLLYIPETGDWADEFLHNGYVLYDQLLYLQVLRTICEIRKYIHGTPDHNLKERAVRLADLIKANYWFEQTDGVPEYVYHEVIYRNGRKAARARNEDRYWMAYFTPHGYGYRFDSFANVLMSLLGVAPEHCTQKVDQYISEKLVHNQTTLMPAFHPVIKPVDDDWKELQATYSYAFRNSPYHYHNGGRWPLLSGFYAADLAFRGQVGLAEQYLDDLNHANALEMDGESWSFPEYLHGRDLTPRGTKHQGWSAAAAVLAHQALDGRRCFRISAPCP